MGWSTSKVIQAHIVLDADESQKTLTQSLTWNLLDTSSFQECILAVSKKCCAIGYSREISYVIVELDTSLYLFPSAQLQLLFL
jgi:hypothetical protein